MVANIRRDVNSFLLIKNCLKKFVLWMMVKASRMSNGLLIGLTLGESELV